MKTTISFSAAALAAFGLLAGAAHAQGTTRVQILHASDLEGGVDAIVDAPNFAAVVDALEADAATKGVESLLLSAGDNYIPGPFFSSAGARDLRDDFRTILGQPDAREGDGRIDISICNVLGLDASAVGNHEFDNGPGTFASIIGTDIRGGTEARWLGAQFPYLSANLDFSGEGALSGLFTSQILDTTAFQSGLSDLVAAAAAPKLAPSAVVTRGGNTYGIVGATTPRFEIITTNGNVTVSPTTEDMVALAAVLQPTIDALTAQGVDKIILVTHLQQFSLEQQLIGLVNDVDIVIAGGSDFLLADGDDVLRPGDSAGGAYPTVATNGNGQPALLVSTAGQYSYVGRLVVDFDANGVVVPGSVVTAESGAYATDAAGVANVGGSLTSPKAAVVKQLTDAVIGIVNAKDGNIVGSADVFLEGRREAVRTEETNFGNLTADANLFAAQSFDATVLVSHKNGGGIRNPIGIIDSATGELLPNPANPLTGKQAGEVSQLDIENTLRFNNGLTLITLTRAQLKEVVETAVAGAGPGNTPGSFGQFAGLSFAYDVAQPAGSRVTYLALSDAHVADPIVVQDGQVVGTGAIRLVTLNFLADGGDGYPFPAFVAADPAFADRVDLFNETLPAGNFTFAGAGTEQDALAEYFGAFFATTPYAVADQPVGDDQRVQQIGTRPILTAAPSSNGKRIHIGVSGLEPFAFVYGSLGTRAGLTPVQLGPLGGFEFGINQVGLLFLGFADFHGDESASLRNPNRPSMLGVTAQVVGISYDFQERSFGFATSNSAAFTLGR